MSGLGSLGVASFDVSRTLGLASGTSAGTGDLFTLALAGLDAHLAAIQARADTVPDALMEMAGTVGQVFRVARGQLPMFLEFWSRAAREPEVWKALSAPYYRYQAFLCTMIKAGIAEGSLRPMNPETAGQLLVSATVGLILQGLVDQNGADWGAVTEEMVTLILNGMERDGS